MTPIERGVNMRRDLVEQRWVLSRLRRWCAATDPGHKKMVRRKRCAACDKDWADPPSPLCPGCQYKEHTS